MTELITRILNFIGQFKLLVIILPWERAARVRLGSRVVVWEPGWHIKLPFVDEIVPVNTRLRIADTGSQTLTAADGRVLTVGIAIGFRIPDPLAALLKMQHPESSCSAIAGSAVAGLVCGAKEPSPAAVEEYVLETLRRETPYEIEFVRVRDFAFARALRLMHENYYRSALVNIEERKL